MGGGLGQARGGTEAGSEVDLPLRPIHVGIVADQPREAEDHLEVTKLHDIAGKDLGVDPMDPHTRSEVVSNSTCRRGVAVDELDGDGLGVLGGLCEGIGVQRCESEVKGGVVE